MPVSEMLGFDKKWLSWFIAFFILLQVVFLILSGLYCWTKVNLNKRPKIYAPREIVVKKARQLLRDHVSNCSGKVLLIGRVQGTANSSLDVGLTFREVKAFLPEIIKSSVPLKETSRLIRGSKLSETNQTKGKNSTKYVYHSGRYWEQLSMNMNTFLSLVLQATLGGRKVVLPRVKNTRLDTRGDPLDIYFNMTQLEDMLETVNVGYTTLIDKEEFLEECSLNDPDYTTVHFLYDQEKAAAFTKRKFHLSDEMYRRVARKAREKGWTECSFIRQMTGQNPKSRMLCVDPTVVTDWKVLERDIVRAAKCLHIVLWRGIGEPYRTKFSENGLRLKSNALKISLQPSTAVMNEVARFRKTHLPGSYIAVYARGEKVVISHGLNGLRQCIDPLPDVIRVWKESAEVDQIFVSSDMSDFGSKSWNDVVKEESGQKMLNELQGLFLSAANGTVYKPRTDLDRGIVALIDMTLLSQAKHLVTIGDGSFHEWIVSKFLDHHRNDPPEQWSIVAICDDTK